MGRGHSTYLESQQYLLSTCWILLQSLVHETRRCTVYPISSCSLLYRPLLRLPFVLVYCTCSLPVPLLSLVSATATPTTPFTLQVAATPHLKSTVATSHHPPQPPPSPTIKLCNRKQGGVIQGGGRKNVMGGGGREQDSIRERTVRGSGAAATAACAQGQVVVDARLGRPKGKSRALLPLGDRIASAAVAICDALIG